MKSSSTARRVILSALAVVAIVAATVAIRHAREGAGHDVASNAPVRPVVAKQPVPARPPGLPQAEQEPVRIAVEQEPPNISPEDAFSSLVESEVSQLHEGITLAQWMNLHGTNEGWSSVRY